MSYSSTLEALRALRGGLALRVDAAKGARHKRLLAQLQALDAAMAPIEEKVARKLREDKAELRKRIEEREQIKAQCDAEIEEACARQAEAKLYSLPRRT